MSQALSPNLTHFRHGFYRGCMCVEQKVVYLVKNGKFRPSNAMGKHWEIGKGGWHGAFETGDMAGWKHYEIEVRWVSLLLPYMPQIKL